MARSKSEKVAERLSDLVNDVTLDLDQIGIYIATNSLVSYRRIMEIAEAARYEREERIKDDNYLF